MLTRFPFHILHHPLLSILVILFLGAGIAWSVQARFGRDGLVRAKKICLACFYICMVLLMLDAAAAWYARSLNPEGYGLLYPLAAALILFPVAATTGILVLVFRASLRR